MDKETKAKIAGPKWVKKANQWCVTITSISKTKQKKVQTQEWFSIEEEAKEYISKNT